MVAVKPPHPIALEEYQSINISNDVSWTYRESTSPLRQYSVNKFLPAIEDDGAFPN